MKRKKNIPEMTVKDKVLSKFTTGRTKSHNKRKKSLLYEYKYRNKTNKFIDRRIGEKNRAMTVEDRLMARFAAERIKRHKRKEMYNLADDDEDITLTHSGRALEDVEKYEDPRSDDDDEDDAGGGKLQADYVKEAHFGGGLFSKVTSDASAHHNIIDELITESKKRKAERQITRERTVHLTEKLDKDLKELLPLVSDQNNADEKNIQPVKTNDSYDLTVNELKFEAVGKPSQKVKSKLEIEIEEKQRLKKLEEERVQRMKRIADDLNEEIEEISEPPSKKHQSADDLNDGLFLNNDEEEDEMSDKEDDNSRSENSSDEEDDNGDEESDIDDNKSDGEVEERLKKDNEKANKNERYDEFYKLLRGKSLIEQTQIIRTVIEERHPSVGGSKQHLMEIFPFLLECLDDTASNYSGKDCWIFAEKVYTFLFDLAQICPDDAGKYVFNKLEEKQRHFNEQTEPRITSSIILTLKVVPFLFPTSDFYHPVVTPTILFTCQMLSSPTSLDSLADIIKGLFCTTLLLEITDLSKKYCPEAVQYLKKVLQAAILHENKVNKSDLVHQIKLSNALVLSSNYKLREISADELRLNAEDLESKTETDMLRIKAIYVALKLCAKFLEYSSEFACSYVIWSSLLNILDKIPVQKFPKVITGDIDKLRANILKLKDRKLNKLMPAKKRPKLLRQYEPNIRTVIDGRSFKTVSEDKLQRMKLLKKYRKELRGAVKEIRKDRNFLAGVKFSEQAKSDAERRTKVKQIYSWGQSQQSELNKLERKKNRK